MLLDYNGGKQMRLASEVGNFHLRTDKYVTTNADLPAGPVRQTLFSTLVDYTSSSTRRFD